MPCYGIIIDPCYLKASSEQLLLLDKRHSVQIAQLRSNPTGVFPDLRRSLLHDYVACHIAGTSSDTEYCWEAFT